MNDATEIEIHLEKYATWELERYNAGVTCPPKTDPILDHVNDCQPVTFSEG